MNRPRRVAILVLSHLAAVAVGAFAAYEFFMRDAIRGMTALGDFSVMSMQETLVDLQRVTGTDAEYEAALNNYLSTLDRLLAAHPNAPDNGELGLWKSRALARLALVAAKRGATAESAQLMADAVRECIAYGKTDCSEQKVREVALYFDKGRSAPDATKAQ
jgi:hypothetical protein